MKRWRTWLSGCALGIGVCALVGTVPSVASASNPPGKLLAALSPSDGSFFGFAMATDGTTVLVGSPGSLNGRGVVDVYAPSGATWARQAFFTPTAPAGVSVTSGEFGTALAMSGTTLVVGDLTGNVQGSPNGPSGVAFVYTKSGTTWKQTATLEDPTATDSNFGEEVAIAGSTIAVGSNAHVDVFAKGLSGTWTVNTVLPAPPGGFTQTPSLALTSNVLAVGGPFYSPDGVNGVQQSEGAVFLYGPAQGKWVPTGQIDGQDTTAGDNFGLAVAFSGSTMLVGAPLHGPGSAYEFTKSGTAWIQRHEFTASDGQPGDGFGAAVALNGTTVLIGAPFANRQSGAAYLFTHTTFGSNWIQQPDLIPPDGWVQVATQNEAGAQFGNAVALGGGDAFVSEPYFAGPNSASGAAFAYQG